MEAKFEQVVGFVLKKPQYYVKFAVLEYQKNKKAGNSEMASFWRRVLETVADKLGGNWAKIIQSELRCP